METEMKREDVNKGQLAYKIKHFLDSEKNCVIKNYL